MTLRHCWDFPNQTIKSFNQNKNCYTSELRNVSQHYFYLISLHFPSIIWLHFLCSILLNLLSLIVALWRQENCQTLLDLAYLLCLPFLQLCFLLTEPNLLNLAFPCSQEVRLHLVMLLDFAYFNILTLIFICLDIYMQHGQNCTKQQNSEIGYGRTDERTDKLSDTFTT